MATNRTGRLEVGRARLLITLGLLCAASCVLIALPAGAQQGPYGSTTTTQAVAGDEVGCAMAQASGSPGQVVEGSVTGVRTGDEVEILLGGTVVAEVVADGAEADGTTTVVFRFAVPSLEPGTYDVVAVGTTFTVTCETPGGRAGFEVIAALDVRGDSRTRGPDATAGAGRSAGSLSFTGFGVLPAVVLAIVLIAAGFALRRWTSRRTVPADRDVRPW